MFRSVEAVYRANKGFGQVGSRYDLVRKRDPLTVDAETERDRAKSIQPQGPRGPSDAMGLF